MLYAHLKKSIHNATLRLVFLYLALFVVFSVVLLGFIYWSTVNYIFKQLDQHIEYDNETLKLLYVVEGEARLIDAINERSKQGSYKSIYLLYHRSGKILAGNLPKSPSDIVDGWHVIELDKGPNTTENHSARILITSLNNELFLLNGLDSESTHKQKQMIFNSLTAGIAIVLLLGAIGGFIISTNTTKKINIINKSIRNIQEGDLSARIPSKGIDDEYDLLSRNINQMLDQIQKLMSSVKNISNNIAHDLRTPLTRLRGRLEMVEKDNSPGTVDGIHEAINEVDVILSTFNALLRISNVESGTQRGCFSVIPITVLLKDVISFYEPIASENQINFELESLDTYQINGDRDMIFQVISNLIDNAIKYSPSESTIRIKTKPVMLKNKSMLEISISDTGIGVPDNEKQKVFEPFYCSDNNHEHKGNGLGLSLVMAIISLHKGRIELKDNKPGLTVKVTI